MADARTATLTRMVLPDHECPHGVRAKTLLEEAGYEIDEHLLTSRAEVDAFKAKHGLATTPLIEIDGRKVGGSSDLERFLAATSEDEIVGDAGGNAGSSGSGGMDGGSAGSGGSGNVSSGGGSVSSAIGQ